MKRIFYLGIAVLGLLCSCSKELPNVDDVCTKMDDINFMNYCYSYFDVNGDGKVSMEEARAVKKLNCESLSIYSFKGIEYFTEIIELICYYNNATSLDLSHCTKLQKIKCGNNKLSSLDLSKCKELERFCCERNESLRSLDVSGCRNLEIICIEKTDVTSIDISDCADEVRIYSNVIEDLDVKTREGQVYHKGFSWSYNGCFN